MDGRGKIILNQYPVIAGLSNDETLFSGHSLLSAHEPTWACLTPLEGKYNLPILGRSLRISVAEGWRSVLDVSANTPLMPTYIYHLTDQNIINNPLEIAPFYKLQLENLYAACAVDETLSPSYCAGFARYMTTRIEARVRDVVDELESNIETDHAFDKIAAILDSYGSACFEPFLHSINNAGRISDVPGIAIKAISSYLLRESLPGGEDLLKHFLSSNDASIRYLAAEAIGFCGSKELRAYGLLASKNELDRGVKAMLRSGV